MTRTSEKAAVPCLRFKGCEGAWTKKVLGEIGVTYNGLSGKSKGDFGHGDGRYVTYLGVFNNAVANPKECGAIEIDSSQNQVRDGDVFFTTSSETPDEVGMSSVWRGDGTNTYLNSFCFGYRPNDKIEIDYWARMLRSTAFRKNIIFLAQGISRYNISKRKVMKLCVSLPGHKEQSKIGECFKWLDQTIGLAESRESSLRQLKRAMLVKMFPRPGQCVPEIRFKGFDDEWEYRTLGYYLQPSGTKNYAMKFSREDVLSVSGEYGIVNQIKFKGRSFAGASVENYGVVERGDIVYTKSPLNQTPYGIIKANLGPAGIVSTLYAVYKVGECADPSFVQTYFSLDGRLNSYLRPLVRKGAKNDMKVSAEGALRGGVIFPSLSEQRKIAAFFRNLDRVIVAAEKKVAKLRQVKASLLERMFV